jgi:amidohydrolase
VVTGKGCHGAMPETGIDPIVVSAELVGALQTIVSRRIGATDSAVLSVTQIHAGDTWNVVPESAVLRGTVRALDAQVQDAVEAMMGRICNGLAQAHGARIDMRYLRGYPSVVNTPAETAAAVEAAAGLVGQPQVHTDIPPAMGSEDFAFMLQQRPGAYIGLGAGEGPNDPPVHSPYYDFNDAVMPLGAAYWVALVSRQLPAG